MAKDKSGDLAVLPLPPQEPSETAPAAGVTAAAETKTPPENQKPEAIEKVAASAEIAPVSAMPSEPAVKERSAEDLNAEIAQRLAQQRKADEEQEKLAQKAAAPVDVKKADAPKATPALQKANAAKDEAKKTAHSLNKAQLAEITPKPVDEAKEIQPIADAKPLVIDTPAPEKPEQKEIKPAPKVQDIKTAQKKPVEAAPAPALTSNAAEDALAAEAANKALNVTRIWEGDKGDSLQKLLKEWAKEVNIELAWNTKESYKLSQNVIISGTFETALNVAFSQAVKNPPRYTLQKGAKPVLIIE